jgi:hypothetical protein
MKKPEMKKKVFEAMQDPEARRRHPPNLEFIENCANRYSTKIVAEICEILRKIMRVAHDIC